MAAKVKQAENGVVIDAKGNVTEIKKEWSVIEDGALAHRLQEEESFSGKRQKTHHQSSDSVEDEMPLAAPTPNLAGIQSSLDSVLQLLLDIQEEQRRQACLIEVIGHQQEAQAEDSETLRQELNVIKAVSSNTYDLVKSCIQRKDWPTDGHNQQRCDQAPTVNRNEQPEMAHPTQMTQPQLNVVDGRLLIPVRHEEIGPNEVHNPVYISKAEYDELRRRNTTAPSFVRALLPYFFAPKIMQRSNFEGNLVLTKNGPIRKDQLNRRLVMSLLDQVHIEFPGQVFERKAYSKIRAVINDKCRHT